MDRVDILCPSLDSVPCRIRNDLFRSESWVNKTYIGKHLHHIKHQFSATHHEEIEDVVSLPVFCHGKTHLCFIWLKSLISKEKWEGMLDMQGPW